MTTTVLGAYGESCTFVAPDITVDHEGGKGCNFEGEVDTLWPENPESYCIKAVPGDINVQIQHGFDLLSAAKPEERLVLGPNDTARAMRNPMLGFSYTSQQEGGYTVVTAKTYHSVDEVEADAVVICQEETQKAKP